MAEPKRNEVPLTSLVDDILKDTQKLIRQEAQLAKVELGRTVQDAKSASALFGAAGASGLIALFLLGVGASMLLSTAGIVLWLSFLIVGVAFAIVAGVFFLSGKRAAEEVQLIPREAVQNVKENVQWIKNQI